MKFRDFLIEKGLIEAKNNAISLDKKDIKKVTGLLDDINIPYTVKGTDIMFDNKSDYEDVKKMLKVEKIKLNEGRPIDKKYANVDTFIKGVAETISNNTATNINAVLEWFELVYDNDKIKIMDLMAKYASSKKWMDIVKAILNNKLLK